MMGLAYAGDRIAKSLVEDEDTSPGLPGRLKEIPWMEAYSFFAVTYKLSTVPVSTQETRCTDVAHLCFSLPFESKME
jgi:hypothetical protein